MKSVLLSLMVFFAISIAAIAEPVVLDTGKICFTLQPQTGQYEILDKSSGVVWKSNPEESRFGTANIILDGKSQTVNLQQCEAKREGAKLTLFFHPIAQNTKATLPVIVEPVADGYGLKFTYSDTPEMGVQSIRLLEKGLWTTDSAKGYVVVPVREGLLIPADSNLKFDRRFDTYEYEGCYMAMAGVVHNGSALLLTWDDPYVVFELKSIVGEASWINGRQALLPSLQLYKSARSFNVIFLGRGDYVSIAKAYRKVAAEKGLLVTWKEKLAGHPDRAKYFGASNVKLWSLFIRRMNEESTKELAKTVNWTFDEAAQVAEHLKKDLQMDKVLFVLGGWIHRGYDSQHPDILPTAPECGGDAAFSDACQRILSLGYLLGLHDNYQDMYRDSPSWNLRFLQKDPSGQPVMGGVWAGGRAYLTCSKMAIELAKRPQNLPAVKKLSNANSYFIDTTYAVGLQECFDKEHPLDKQGDMYWKRALSDYARSVFGSFGSECGREWAIPHADFFEGLVGVGGHYYHGFALPKEVGASVIPLFELVFHDCIAMYGKYGYDHWKAAEYVLHHIAMGRPLHYHSIPPHLYWKEYGGPLDVTPAVDRLENLGSRKFKISYRWTVKKTPTVDARVLVHFVDTNDENKSVFGNDHDPKVPVSQWKPGEILEGPFTIALPEKYNGKFRIYAGLYDPVKGKRYELVATKNNTARVFLGTLIVDGDKITFEAPEALPVDDAIFVRADQGWAEGLHPVDCFMKNTHEILSPLNEITAQMVMTRHEFLSSDRKVQHSVFGEAPEHVDVVVNMGKTEYLLKTRYGGEVTLPPYGFVIESPTYVAFYAKNWNGVNYSRPSLFTLRSLDDKPLSQSGKIRVFHAFGDTVLKLGDKSLDVRREAIAAEN